MPEFAQRLGFDLANTFPGDPELAAHFFQGPIFAIAKSETKFDDLSLALGQLAQRLRDLLPHQLMGSDLDRLRQFVILDEVTKERIPV